MMPGAAGDEPVAKAPGELGEKLRRFVPSLWYGLQTGVTAAVCFEVARATQLSQGYWAGMSAIVVLQADMVSTRNAATDRLIGTALGAVLGWFCGSLGGARHSVRFAIGVTLAILICRMFRLDNAGRLAGLTVAVVVLIGTGGPLWRVALDRFFEISIGVVIAVAVSWVAAQLRKVYPALYEA